MNTNKISTLRQNGFSVVNCTGFTCLITSDKPFTYGNKQVNEQREQGDYGLVIKGQFKKELPKIIIQ